VNILIPTGTSNSLSVRGHPGDTGHNGLLQHFERLSVIIMYHFPGRDRLVFYIIVGKYISRLLLPEVRVKILALFWY
jgi:hypothetical protein